jgi:hypothetical protein
MPAITKPFHGKTTELHITSAIGGALSAATVVGEVDDLGALESTRAIVDMLNYNEDDVQRLAGAKDNGSVSVTLNWNPADADHETLVAAYETGDIATFAIQWNSGANSARADFSAIVSEMSISHPKEDGVKATVELSISGPVTFDRAPA